MIVDTHTHIWTSLEQLGSGAKGYLTRQAGPEGALDAAPRHHAQASRCSDKTLVLGYRSRHLGADVPNDLIADYVAAQGDRMIGIAAIDPTEPDAPAMAEQWLDRKEFRGLTFSPAAQDFHPADSRAMYIYELASRRRVPIIIQQSTHFPTEGSMSFARPMLLDEIAREFSDLTLVVTSLGHPWIEECIALLGKHPRVFSDIAGLIRRPWQAYNALVLAHQFNVMDKVLFGSDFPYCTASLAIESLYRLHEVTQGTNLPSVPRETLRGMVERDALNVLGIARPGEQATSGARADEEEVDIDA
jgi:hypothetical protein